MAAPITDAPTATANGLPTQVTPFSFNAPGDSCHLSVYCPYLSYWNYLSIPNIFASQNCLGVQTGGRRNVSPAATSRYFRMITSLSDLAPGRQPTKGIDQPWHTRELLVWRGGPRLAPRRSPHEGLPHSQAWCCPSSGWSCATETYVSDWAAPQRLCQSPLSESTTIWMTWDLAYSNNGSDLYTWTARVTSEEPQNEATVFHKVFPLQLTTGVESTTGGQGSPSETAGNEHDASGSSLSKGAIAGISVGSALAVLFILFGMFLLYRRRKKRSPEPESAALQQAQQPQDPWEGKPELDGSAAARPEEAPKTELDAVDAARASTALTASVSELGTLSPRSVGGDGFPSPESRHNHVFEMQG
ncbi:hypothetical protein PG993_012388 [Apiospora rasikravindrae]|uniref:Uncharacterized protein n=1 Tax=Apiospora rasikravindrae TaxID=990691 RepID=A0ABR1S3N1_9PEZI